MSERMPDKRLAEIRKDHAAYEASHAHAGSFACCSAHSSADDVPELLAEVERLRGELDEARELATVSLDILRNVSNESMRELFGVDDMGELPSWFTRYGTPKDGA